MYNTLVCSPPLWNGERYSSELTYTLLQHIPVGLLPHAPSGMQQLRHSRGIESTCRRRRGMQRPQLHAHYPDGESISTHLVVLFTHYFPASSGTPDANNPFASASGTRRMAWESLSAASWATALGTSRAPWHHGDMSSSSLVPCAACGVSSSPFTCLIPLSRRSS